MAVVPVKAATVILLRDTPNGPFEVFLLKRHEDNRFMGGMFVYPGGKIEAEDWEAARALGAQALLPQREYRAAGLISRDEHIASCIAAIRELFEEAHVLLARIAGCPAAHPEPHFVERLMRRGQSGEAHNATFCTLLAGAGLQPAIGDLCYYAHWITPQARPIRFDTHFFLARLPAGQDALADPRESSAGMWITPAEALAENLRGAIALSPPTLKTIEEIAPFRTADELLASLSPDPVPATLPAFVASDSQTFLVFPGDEEYEAYQAGTADGSGGNGRLSGPGDTTTRVVFSGPGCVPYSKPPAGPISS